MEFKWLDNWAVSAKKKRLLRLKKRKTEHKLRDKYNKLMRHYDDSYILIHDKMGNCYSTPEDLKAKPNRHINAFYLARIRSSYTIRCALQQLAKTNNKKYGYIFTKKEWETLTNTKYT